MPFKKYRLLSYKMEDLQALSTRGISWQLEIEVWTWWGLKKKIVFQKEVVGYSFDAENFWKPKVGQWLPEKKKK